MVFRIDAREAFRKRPRDWEREPLFPTESELLEVGGRILNPLEAVLLPGDALPGTTAYVADAVLVGAAEQLDLGGLEKDSEFTERGWRVIEDPNFEPVLTHDQEENLQGVTRLLVIADGETNRLPAPIDAYVVLQLLRQRGVNRAGLDHVYVTHTRGHTSGHTEDDDERPATGRYRSSGGRLPVAYAGRPPARTAELKHRRPVVGVLDTGCGEHDWLVDGVHRNPGYVDSAGVSHPIGWTASGPADSEEDTNGDLVGPLNGELDRFSGHGTFICGLIRQGCPDADILSWRIVPTTGLVRESDLINALAGVINLVRSGQALDVLNLSLGHYHELNPAGLSLPARVKQVADLDPAVAGLLRTLSSLGVAVVCSAGNDATARPMFPAAYAVLPDSWPIPVTAVGSLNPDRATVSIRSNTGDWVTAYQPGAHVFSTLPGYRGGQEPTNRTQAAGRTRESVDPDNFTRAGAVGGFALWNGSSFAAPIQAALIARAIGDELSSKQPDLVRVAEIVRAAASAASEQ